MSQSFLNQVKQGSIEGWHRHKILPSITGAQAVIESGWGKSDLARPPYNALFGIKASADWPGKVTEPMPTQEWNGHAMVWTTARFRAYESWGESVADHGTFFTSTTWRKNNYRRVIGERNYKTAAQELKNAGYATDPDYPSKLIRIIEQHNLQAWDQEAFSGGTGASVNQPIAGKTVTSIRPSHTVGGDITSSARSDAHNRQITVIGDSLGVGTKPYLEQMDWLTDNYSVYGSRQWTHGTKIYDALAQLQDLLNANMVNEIVIFILGTNRGVNDSEIERAVRMCGTRRKLILVDTASEVGHRTKVSSAYKKASETYDNVFHANWMEYARSSIGSWYHADGSGGTRIHMNGKGYKKHAEFIAQTVFEVVNSDWSPKTQTSSQAVNNASILDLDYQDDRFYSPKGESAIYNPSLNQQFGFRAHGGEPMWIEHVIEVNTTDEIEMLEAGIKYLEEHSTPGVQHTVPLKYLPNDVSIGDTGQFIDHDFNPPLYIEGRVLEIITSESNPNQDAVVIGNVKELYPQDKTDLIALQKQLQETREELLEEYWNKPIDITIEATNGFTLDAHGRQSKKVLSNLDNRVFKAENEFSFRVKPASDTSNTFMLHGEVINNFSDDIAKLTAEMEREENDWPKLPVEPWENPQGNPQQEVVDEHDIHRLKVEKVTVEFKDIQDTVLSTQEAILYHDSRFHVPVTQNLDKIERITIKSATPIELKNVHYVETSHKVTDSAQSTQLIVRLIQDNIDITERFTDYVWTRVSNDSFEDDLWNDSKKFSSNSFMTIYPADVDDLESTFICRVFDDNGNYVGSTSATIKLAGEGKSAFEVWKEFTGNYSATEADYLEAIQGDDGLPGDDGVGIISTNITYGISSSENVKPSVWMQSVPATTPGEWMWTQTMWRYSDGTDEIGYSKTYIAKDGNNGSDGIPGKDGVGIKNTLIHYAVNQSGTLQPTVWYTQVPATNPGDFVWTRTTWEYDDGTSEQGFSVGKIGDTGEKGAPAYNHTAYANKNSDGTFVDFTLTDTNRDFEGVMYSHDERPSMNPADYEWKQSVFSVNKDIQNRATKNEVLEVRNQVTSLNTILEAKADATALAEQERRYQDFLTQVQTSATQAANLAQQVNDANATIQNNLNNQAERWNTLDGYIQIDGATNSITIRNINDSTQIILDDEGLKFMDGGVMVGIVSGQYLEILRGIFAQSVQIGRHKFEPLASDPDHLILSYVGGK